MSYYESILRREGLYPEPYPEGTLSLEELEESGHKLQKVPVTPVDYSACEFAVRSLRCLTSRQRKILRMVVEGKSLREIGRALGISQVAVWKQLRRIRG